jgi:hypothetical protein
MNTYPVFIKKDNKTICLIKSIKSQKILAYGKAKYNPIDIYNQEIGERKSYLRAKKKIVKKEIRHTVDYQNKLIQQRSILNGRLDILERKINKLTLEFFQLYKEELK